MNIELVKNYLRIDSNDEDNFLNTLIEISQIYIDSMVGENYKSNEKALKLRKPKHKYCRKC